MQSKPTYRLLTSGERIISGDEQWISITDNELKWHIMYVTCDVYVTSDMIVRRKLNLK